MIASLVPYTLDYSSISSQHQTVYFNTWWVFKNVSRFICKDLDRVTVQILVAIVDMTTSIFAKARFVSVSEAVSRLFQLDIVQQYHSVIQSDVYDEIHHTVNLQENNRKIPKIRQSLAEK